jgi:large subunit ribosomal protein L21
MYAVIETGGKQYRVQEGDVITVEKLKNVEAGDKVTFENVLFISGDGDVQVGTPFLEASVFGKVVESGKGQKVIIYKYKSKKDYHKKQGHRQPYTMVEITGIGEDKKSEKKEEPKAEPKKESAEKKSEATGVNMSMKKDELIAYAKENNIEIDEKATKQVIVDTITESGK